MMNEEEMIKEIEIMLAKKEAEYKAQKHQELIAQIDKALEKLGTKLDKEA
jgi:hypothetical protein